MFRAEVIGSMLRPSYLKEGRAAFEQGSLSTPELKRLEDRAVDEVIALQESAGVDVVTDGEMRRFLFTGPITERVEGITPAERDVAMPWSTPEGDIEWSLPVAVTGKLRRTGSMVAEEYSYARARAQRPLKVTVPSPLMLFGMWSPRHAEGVYADAFEMFADAAEIGRAEILELVSLGCEHVQVDAPELATLVDPRVRDWAESLGFGADRMLSEGLDLINAMVQGITGVRLGIHLCRGNNAGMWMASGGYDYIAKALFQRATAFDAFFLEYDDARSGSFEPLKDAPDDKQVVLGLVSTKTPELEGAEDLSVRIDEAARFFPREQLGLSTQCGFASVVDGNAISELDEERKLRLVADTAHAVWG